MKTKPVDISPVPAVYDRLSSPDQVKGWAWLQNYGCYRPGALSRRTGWSKLMLRSSWDVNTSNDDWHNQTVNPKEAITLLQQVTSHSGTRYLVAGTQTQLSVWDGNNWKTIVDTKESIQEKQTYRQERWQLATAYDSEEDRLFADSEPSPNEYFGKTVVIATDDSNKPRLWNITNSANALDVLVDMDIIGLTKAKLAYQWKGVVFLADVVMTDGVGVDDDGINGAPTRHYNRIVWSEYQKPNAWDPAVATYTFCGNQDLSLGETILGLREFGNMLLVFTDKSISALTLSQYSKIDGTSGDSVQMTGVALTTLFPFQPTGNACVKYPSTICGVGDGIVYLAKDGLYFYNPGMPMPARIEWAQGAIGDSNNGVLGEIDEKNTEAPVIGFNTVSHELWLSYVAAPASYVATQATYIWNHVFQMMQLVHNVGDVIQSEAPVMPNRTVVFNFKTKSCDHVDYGFSAFTEYVNANGKTMFLGASSSDNCIKDLSSGVYHREERQSNGYALLGYQSRIVSGAYEFGASGDKTLNAVEVEIQTNDSGTSLELTAGSSVAATDPMNSVSRNITWTTAGVKLGVAGNTTGLSPRWPVYKCNRYLYFDIHSQGQPTGGQHDISRITMEVKK